MTFPVFEPTLANNFFLTMWEVQGPADFGAASEGAAIGAGLASALVSTASQFLFGQFSKIEGLESAIDAEAYLEGGRNGAYRQFPSPAKVPKQFKCSRGVTTNTEIWDWYAQVLDGKRPVLRKSGLIFLLEPNYAPRAAWLFDRGLPGKLTGPTFDAQAAPGTIAIESLEIVHEGIRRVSLSAIPGAADIASMLGGVFGMATTSVLNAF